ncbi:MAG: HEPN domain-containing protein [Deltaproteobacteria bacterium]|nr:HEPN domain-containing protein [Deltaproteobacteria bacterium]MBI3019007.1 HEPN domain-containing protein [Deltaproteobacteria bacterium]
MKKRSLTEDYLLRSQHRLAAIELLYKRKSWADVVCEAQKVVELALKALLKHFNIEIPWIHDVSQILKDNEHLFSSPLKKYVTKLSQISRYMRRDLELSFYGSEDLTPSEFYKESDAKKAKEDATWLVQTVLATLAHK